MEYNKNNHLRVVTLCSGYDSQCLALERLKAAFPPFDYELIAWAEFDPESNKPIDKQPAVIAHNALFPQWADRNLGDMTKIDWHKVPDFDLLFYSTPCKDISQAGLQKGFKEGSGTRSALIWYAKEALRIKRPKFACLENVGNMVNQHHIKDFHLWQHAVEELGYSNFSHKLNAKHYGVPQNRERIFLVSIYDPTHTATYHFPEPMKLEKTLIDLLEDNVDKKYYLSYAKVDKFVKENKKKILSYAHKSNEPILPLPFDLKEMIDNAKEDTNDTEQQEA